MPSFSQTATRTSVGQLPAPAPAPAVQPLTCSAPASSAARELATDSERFSWAWMPTGMSSPATSASIRARAIGVVIAPAESTQ